MNLEEEMCVWKVIEQVNNYKGKCIQCEGYKTIQQCEFYISRISIDEELINKLSKENGS
jgi:hypothetical protein